MALQGKMANTGARSLRTYVGQQSAFLGLGAASLQLAFLALICVPIESCLRTVPAFRPGPCDPWSVAVAARPR